MDAGAKSLDFLRTEGELEIPFFQRAYVWNKNNWDKLLDDLLNRQPNQNNFLGSLILKQCQVGSGQVKKALVIDGQQRLTTLSILLKALYDSLSTERQQHYNSSRPLVSLLHKDYLNSPTKIQHSYYDKQAYENVITGKNNSNDLCKICKDKKEEQYKDCQTKIKCCYNFFRQEIEKAPQDTKWEQLYDYLINPSSLILVVIDLKAGDNEQVIFDTINSAGIRLSVADLIKNDLFRQAIEVYGKDNEAKMITLYKETWWATFLKDEDTIKYWDTVFNDNNTNNIEQLIHAFAVIQGIFDPTKKHTLPQLVNLYKKKIASLTTEENLKKFIDNLVSYAQTYREKFIEVDKATLCGYEDYTTRMLNILWVTKYYSFIPYLLHLFVTYKNDEDTLKKELKKLEIFLVRSYTCHRTTKDYNMLCKTFLSNPNQIEVKTVGLDDDQFKQALLDIDNKRATLLLFWVELHRRYKDNRFDDGSKELKYCYSLEHLMPQKWQQHWPVANNDKAKREQAIYKIGNMTLLSKNLNSSLSNHSFLDKLNGQGRKKGIKYYASALTLNSDIISKAEWNEQEIENRTTHLTKEIITIFSLP